MLSVVKSMALEGLEGYLVEVETDISAGLPCFNVVGLPDTSIKEAKERVKSAIKNTGFEFPSRKIVINLSPANKRKEGTVFDLPIAIGMLIAIGEIKKDKIKGFEDTIFLGELSLNGKINRVNGILPKCLEAKELGIKRVIVPKANSREAGVIEGIDVIPVRNLQEIVEYINGDIEIVKRVVDIKQELNNDERHTIDFSDIKGQESAKRALEIAAAGGHNCLLIRKSRIGEKHDGPKSIYYFARLNI